MRIRRRPPFSSFPSFATPSPHSLRDPSLHLPPLAPNGRDASASNGGGAKEGKAAPELHPDAHPPKDPHGFAQDPCYRRTPLHPHLPPPPPPPPRLDPYDDDTKGRSIRSGSTHLTDVGHGKVQDFGEEEAAAAAAAESEEERGVSLVDAKMGWDDDAQQVNSSMRRIDGSSGASILLEAARQLDAAAATEKRKKGKVEGCDDWGSDEKLKEEEKEEKKKKKKRDEVKARGRRSAGDASSLRNNCTGVDGKDNDGYRNGDGPAAVMEEEEEEDKGGVAVNNGGGRSNGKKRRSPAVLMEGSRCSRVNGRGWRCCQQTLVGYSLCEHHLGKGRLRSMSSVRGQIGATTRPKKQNSKTPPPAGPEEDDEEKRAVHLEEQQQQEQQQEKNEPLEVEELEGVNSEDKATKKRRKKAGAVKARSISSLLDGVEPSTAQSLISGDYEAMA